jgi:hypothetical protein
MSLAPTICKWCKVVFEFRLAAMDIKRRPEHPCRKHVLILRSKDTSAQCLVGAFCRHLSLGVVMLPAADICQSQPHTCVVCVKRDLDRT